MPDAINSITAETLSMMKPAVKKALTQGFTVGTGLTGYELEEPSKKLFPVWSPFRNRIPRVHAGQGSAAAHWKAISRINATRQRPSVAFGAAGPLVSTEELDFQSNYYPIALGDSVQMDAQMLARGFEDLRATAGINLLYAQMIEEDRFLLGAQNFATPQPPAPVLAASATGGSIPNTTTVHVRVRARNHENYYFGGGSLPSADVSVATAGTDPTNSVSASVPVVDQYGNFNPALAGVVAYDWYVSSNGTDYFYYGTTTVNSITVTAIPSSDNPAPRLPELADPDTWANAQADTSADPNTFNGLLGTLSGAYLNGTFVSPGTPGSKPSGALFQSLNGSKLHASAGRIVEIDNAIRQIWDNVQLSPTRILVSGEQMLDLTAGIVKSGQGGGGTYKFIGNDPAEARSLHAGYAVIDYTNPIFPSQPIAIETMPHLQPGTIIILTEVLPYPNNQVANVLEVETQQEYQQLEYAMSRQSGNNGGPRYDFEVRAIETFKNYFPASMAVIQNIASGEPIIS
ncbi:MAG: hypothetical protein ABF969_11875 [Sporolactobacillus sp.]